MYILVIGCSKIGYHLTKALLASSHEVVVVEKNRARCDLLTEELGSVALQGDGTDQTVLRKAGASRADVVVAATNRDDTNLVACQVAKHVFHAPSTMALIKDPRNEPVFQILGVDAVVNSTHLVLENLEERIPGRTLLRLMNLGTPAMQLVSITIPDDATVVGKRLGDVELPPRSFISVVVKKSGVERPTGDLVLEADDGIIAVTPGTDEQTLYDILTGT
ncbi:MAG: hypothetical protein BZY88_02525 [SAR202 cluster bacterium Io17-Chloro-G9]|nr:MAG: hypothetical protein BZY88_02525 [SAR202 cluster bacterium Io17-Chloro-G9]